MNGVVTNINVEGSEYIRIPAVANYIADDLTSTYKYPVWNGYDTNKMSCSGTNKANVAGWYKETFTLKNGFKWTDGSSDLIEVYWRLHPKPLDVIPVQNGTLTFNGTEQTVTFANTTNITFQGCRSALSAGTYICSAYPNNRCCWNETDDVTPINILWNIDYAIIPTPTISSSIEYKEEYQVFPYDADTFDPKYCHIEGDLHAKYVGTYYVYITPDENHCWEDGTRTTKRFSYSITEKPVNIPTVARNPVYNGSYQLPELNDYNEKYMYISTSTAKKVDVGNYSLMFILKPGYKWSDGTTDNKTISWSLLRRPVPFPILKENYELLPVNNDNYKFVFRNFNPLAYKITTNLTATNDTQLFFRVTLNDNYCWEDGTTDDKRFSIVHGTLLPGPYLDINDISWTRINSEIKMGIASQLYEVGTMRVVSLDDGDSDTTSVSITTDLGVMSYNKSTTIRIVLIGIDHNSSIEGNNKLHWGINIIYTSPLSTTATNVGGWKETVFRKQFIPQLLNYLPTDLKTQICKTKKYTDNTGNKSGLNSDVTALTDYGFLLSEFEYRGVCQYANQYEQNYQEQYELFKNSVGYRISNLQEKSIFTRSPSSMNTTSFVIVGHKTNTSSQTTPNVATGIQIGFTMDGTTNTISDFTTTVS